MVAVSGSRRASLRLDERDPQEVAVALAHPAQVTAQELIAELIEDLRGCEGAEGLQNFQRVLFQRLYETEEHRAAVKRNVERVRRGRATPPAPSGSWDYELMVADRLCRQFRCVGDALAWRAFGYDRKPLLALARNELPGPMFGKSGLGSELRFVLDAWKERRRFALLHDLTNTLRMGDLTEFSDDQNCVWEVKASDRASHSRRASDQRRRLEQAVAVINHGDPLAPDGTQFMATEVALRTRLDLLEPVFKQSRREGLAVKAISDGIVVTTLAASSVDILGSHEEVTAIYDLLERQAMAEAMSDADTHYLKAYSVDSRDCHAAVAPYSIFPFDHQTCAELVTDRLAVAITVAWSNLAAPFERRGWRTHCPLLVEGATPPSEVLVATRDDRVITLYRDAVIQALVEFHDLDQFVAGALDALGSGGPGNGVLVFSSEHEVWR